MFDVLIIEDQPAIREIIAEIISSLDISMKIVEAINIKQAEVLLNQQDWNIIITDLSLGDGNSLDLFERRESQGNPLPNIILVSGFLSSQHLQQAQKLGIKHILAKPFDPDILLKHIQGTLLSEDEIKTNSKLLKPEQADDVSHGLLPEVFEMDRKLGLIFRMFDEMPKQPDIPSIGFKALQLAMDIVHAQGGYIALFERHKETLVCIAEEGLGHENTLVSCHINQTPFAPLIHNSEEYIEAIYNPNPIHACWPNIYTSSYIAIPIYLQGIPMGILCLVDPQDKEPIKGESLHMLGLLVKKLDTLLDNRAVHAALAESMNETLIALVRSLEARDRYTKDHSSRVSSLSVIFAQTLGLDDDTTELIRTGGLLHDIGKVGVADSVLLKPGRYTDQEYAIMKAHPAIGDSILHSMDTLARERLIVRHHHERWDGKGYPDKIGEEEIPFEARIVCVADAIDAMTTHRVYRQAKPLSFCAEQLELASGTQFDPQVVAVALDAIKQGKINTQAKFIDYNEGVLPLQASLAQKLQEQFIH